MKILTILSQNTAFISLLYPADLVCCVTRQNNDVISEEIADLTDQLSDGGKSVHELQKMKKKIEMEKDELQASLEESEAALEVHNGKIIRAGLYKSNGMHGSFTRSAFTVFKAATL